MDYTCLVFMIVLLLLVMDTHAHFDHCVGHGRNIAHPECVSPIVARKFRYGY